jgi:ADP-ribose pyrophosphatase YjhB (NUDIX family)
MPQAKEGISSKGKKMHYSVGALIKKDNKYLLMDRNTYPFGYAPSAGHVDEGEAPEIAVVREVKEEVGLEVTNFKLLFEEEREGNICSKGAKIHYWYVYKCDVKGELHRNLRETKSVGWFSAEEIAKLKLEPTWEYFFKKLEIL